MSEDLRYTAQKTLDDPTAIPRDKSLASGTIRVLDALAEAEARVDQLIIDHDALVVEEATAEDYDTERYSPVKRYDSVDDVWWRLTWKDLAEERYREASRLNQWAGICADLDRCEHGRHEGDVCSGCNGPSHGNRLIGHAPIGHGIGTEHIYVPERSRKGVPENWRVSGPCRDPEQVGTACPIGEDPIATLRTALAAADARAVAAENERDRERQRADLLQEGMTARTVGNRETAERMANYAMKVATLTTRAVAAERERDWWYCDARNLGSDGEGPPALPTQEGT